MIDSDKVPPGLHLDSVSHYLVLQASIQTRQASVAPPPHAGVGVAVSRRAEPPARGVIRGGVTGRSVTPAPAR